MDVGVQGNPGEEADKGDGGETGKGKDKRGVVLGLVGGKGGWG